MGLLQVAAAALLVISAQQSSQPAAPPTDEALRATWRSLEPAAQQEVLDWVQAELEFEGSFQQTLLRHVLGAQDRAPSEWPADSPPPMYDAVRHAPAQPIARKLLPQSGAKAKALRERVFARVPERKLDSAWRYDYGTRELRRAENEPDLDRRFENLLRGFPADLDLAEALVERALDDGAEQTALRAFGHAYSDRAGNVAPGITLYDAWCSGIQMEMPDVECLGIVHDVLDDWRTWRAPIPSSKHAALYARIGELFQAAHRHRGLRHALARAYLVGEPVLRDSYGPHVERLHVVWDVHASDPVRLAAELPAPADWRTWLEGWALRCKEEPELLERGRVRARTLAADQRRVRETLAVVLEMAAAQRK